MRILAGDIGGTKTDLCLYEGDPDGGFRFHADLVNPYALAERLEVSPGAVTAMIKRLAEAGLVSYEPYHGVELTERRPTHDWGRIETRYIVIQAGQRLGHHPPLVVHLDPVDVALAQPEHGDGIAELYPGWIAIGNRAGISCEQPVHQDHVIQRNNTVAIDIPASGDTLEGKAQAGI